ncbi:MAG: hypothetical protein RLY31_2918 [Bacteroidota bacterium]
MSLVKWRNPNLLMPAYPNWMESIFRDDDFFANRWNMEASMPAVNVLEKDDTFQLEVAAPGMKKADFNLEVKDGMLHISAEKSAEKEKAEKGYTRREFSYNAFSRSFWLPEDIRTEDIKANYTDGILKIEIPRTNVTKRSVSKLIEIK